MPARKKKWPPQRAELSGEALVKLAIKQKGKTLKNSFPNIHYLNDSIKIVKGRRKDVLGIYVVDKNIYGIPKRVQVKLANGKNRFIQTEIIAEVGMAKVTGGMDGSVSNEELFGYAGSGCCLVSDKNQKNYLVSNCHVMTDGFLQNPLFDTGKPNVMYDSSRIGVWTYGSMSSMGDFALIEVEDLDSFIINNDPELFKNQIRELVKDDWLKLKVTARGNKCKMKMGFIIEVIKKQLKIQYKDGHILVLDEAILVGDRPDKTTCFPVTQEGDSGGALYDENNKMIGIITSKSNKYTYVIPIKRFLQSLSSKII